MISIDENAMTGYPKLRENKNRLKVFISVLRCPACGGWHLIGHGTYPKNYYSTKFTVQRVLCKDCGKTHALIPYDSLPGASLDTIDYGTYIKAREAGVSRREAADVFRTLDPGVKNKIKDRSLTKCYLTQLEKRFNGCCQRGKALLPEAGDPYKHGLAWIRSVVGNISNLIVAMNQYCLDNRVNCIFNSRFNILAFG